MRQKTEFESEHFVETWHVRITYKSFLENQEFLKVYSLSGTGGVSDQLPMKLKKNTKGISTNPFPS